MRSDAAGGQGVHHLKHRFLSWCIHCVPAFSSGGHGEKDIRESNGVLGTVQNEADCSARAVNMNL